MGGGGMEVWESRRRMSEVGCVWVSGGRRDSGSRGSKSGEWGKEG
jgi:hypothetical protein